jgi:cation transporter-like permease
VEVDMQQSIAKCPKCGQEIAPDEQFCGNCGTPRPRLPPRFEETEKQYAALKARYEARQLSEADYDAALTKLVIQDESGACWMIGAKTGQWYRYDGQQWVRAEPVLAAVAAERPAAEPAPPPSAAPRAPVEAAPARPGTPSAPLWTAIGWAVGWALGGGLGLGWALKGTQFAYPPNVLVIAIAGAIGGCIVGLALQRGRPLMQREQALAVATAWAISWSIGWAIGAVIRHIAFPVMVEIRLQGAWERVYAMNRMAALGLLWAFTSGFAGFIAGIVAGAIAGLMLLRVFPQRERPPQWRQVPILAIGWPMGWALGGVIGWAIGWRLAAAVAYNSARAISAGASFYSVVVRAIEEGGGFVCGAIGGSLVLWLLSRAERRA